MMRAVVVAVALAAGLSMPAGASTVQQLSGGVLSAATGTSIRALAVESGGFCLKARNGCRRGAAEFSFDAPQSEFEIDVTSRSRNSKAVVMLYAGDQMVQRVRVTKSQTLTFDVEGITHVTFTDRSKGRGMMFAVTSPMDDATGSSSGLGGTEVANIPAVPVPAGFPLLLAGLASVVLMARRRARA
jgi:hypothetical protein